MSLSLQFRCRLTRNPVFDRLDAIPTVIGAGLGADGSAAGGLAPLSSGLGQPSLRELLMGSSFFYSPNADPDTDPPASGLLGQWAAWGNTAATHFGGADGELAINGEVAYTHPEAIGGAVTSTLTHLAPFARFELSERTSLWGTLGYGAGGLTLTPDRTATAIATDIASTMAAFGGRPELSARSTRGGRVRAFNLAVVSDMRVTSTSSDTVSNLVGATGETGRARLMLEGRGMVALANGGMPIPSLEAGVRYDRGDAETGAGLEVGAGLGYSAGRLALQVNARGLVAHEDTAYEEWGLSSSITYRAREDGRGVSLRMGSALGAAQSGVHALWSRQNAAGLARDGADMYAGQSWQAQLGYGVGDPTGRALWVPYIGADAGAGGSGSQALRLGVRLTSGPNAVAGLEFGQRGGGLEGPERALRLEGSIRF